MKKNKIYDCITFFNENFLTNLRFEILNEVVDFFVICESRYDHMGNKKKLNFNLLNKKFKSKIRYIIIEEQFPDKYNGWERERFQREKIFDGIKDAKNEDYIIYSDSDEIPDPNKLKNIKLEYKYGIFLQKFFVYKLNIFNKYETPWEGSRICKKKNLKSFTHLRKKILKKNLKKGFWKIHIEKNICLIENGGWHFNNLYPIDIISQKLKVFPHREFSSSKFYDQEVIKKKILNLEDLFGRGHRYQQVNIDQTYPEFLYKNLANFQDYIL